MKKEVVLSYQMDTSEHQRTAKGIYIPKKENISDDEQNSVNLISISNLYRHPHNTKWHVVMNFRSFYAASIPQRSSILKFG